MLVIIRPTKNKRQANIITVTEKGLDTLDKLTDIIKPLFDDVHKKMKESEIEHLKNGLINPSKAILFGKYGKDTIFSALSIILIELINFLGL